MSKKKLFVIGGLIEELSEEFREYNRFLNLIIFNPYYLPCGIDDNIGC